MVQSRLNKLQQQLLEAFFEHRSDFYLTGGAALAGYYLGHRTTDDLDLFSTTASMDEGVRALKAAAANIGASVENVTTSPDFRRLLVRLDESSLVVDLVIEQTPQVTNDKIRFGNIRVDPADEILANKLCALLSRAEIRDIVDILRLEQAGFDIAKALESAQKKDGGLTPAQLAWVISQIEIGDDAVIPSGLTPTEIRRFLTDLEKKLRKIAFPG